MLQEAITQLTDHQRQLDTDGSFVGVSRQALEELLEHYSNSGDRAIAIGEDAFKAGWEARSVAIDAYLMHDETPDVEAAWSDYEPSEDIKALA